LINCHSIKQFAYCPRLLTAPNCLMIRGQGTIVRNAGAVLKQLAQRVGVAANPLVQAAVALRN
jgi:hypothetical protein